MMVDVQDKYEYILADHWKKLHEIRELVDTSTGSALRVMSITERQKELARIESDKAAFERHFDGLVEPDWYIDWINKLTKYKDPFYIH